MDNDKRKKLLHIGKFAARREALKQEAERVFHSKVFDAYKERENMQKERLLEIVRNAVFDETFYTSHGEPVATYPRRVVDAEMTEFFVDYLIRNGVYVEEASD